MATGEYVIIRFPMDKLTEEARNTPLTDQLQVGESISFYKDGELVKTSTILAKAILVGTETETPTGTTAQAHIAADAPFVYLPDTVFKEIYRRSHAADLWIQCGGSLAAADGRIFEQLCRAKILRLPILPPSC